MWCAKGSTRQGAPNVGLRRSLHFLWSEGSHTPPHVAYVQYKFCTTFRMSLKVDSKHLLRRLIPVSAVVSVETAGQGTEKTCSVEHFA